MLGHLLRHILVFLRHCLTEADIYLRLARLAVQGASEIAQSLPPQLWHESHHHTITPVLTLGSGNRTLILMLA